MGEIAEGMVNGTLCQDCGAYIGEGGGFPRSCCGDDDFDTADYAAERAQKQKRRERNRGHAGKVFIDASTRASQRGLQLLRRSDQHYQLIGPDWLLDVYPGNHRLYRPTPGRRYPTKAPFLKVPYGAWTLMDVVEAAPAVAGSTGEQT